MLLPFGFIKIRECLDVIWSSNLGRTEFYGETFSFQRTGNAGLDNRLRLKLFGASNWVGRTKDISSCSKSSEPKLLVERR